MSKQLTYSATLCAFALALFAIASDRAPPSGVNLHGPAVFAPSASMGH